MYFLIYPSFPIETFLSSRANWFCLFVYLLSSSLNSWRLKTLYKVSNLFHTSPCPWSLSHFGDIHFLTLKMLLSLFPLLGWLSRPAAQLAPRACPSHHPGNFACSSLVLNPNILDYTTSFFFGLHSTLTLDLILLSLCWTVFLRTLKELPES